jgi:hypothetical protein
MLQKYNVEEDPIDPTPPQLSPLSLISSLQLDELELELEELEELELDDHLKGSLLLGWRGETLAFALDVANEDVDA